MMVNIGGNIPGMFYAICVCCVHHDITKNIYMNRSSDCTTCLYKVLVHTHKVFVVECTGGTEVSAHLSYIPRSIEREAGSPSSRLNG